MSEEKTPGLLLQAIPYLGQSKILKLFTPEQGLLSLLVKRTKNSALTSPFCLAEWVYKKGNRDIYSFTDGSLLNGFLDLRDNYAVLSSAGSIAQDLLRTQLPGKRAPELFALSCSLFQQLPRFQHPEILPTLFRLKFLLLEGLISLERICAKCSEPACSLIQGESFCSSHSHGPSFYPEEWELLHILSSTRSYSLLKELPSLGNLHKKIFDLFNERLN